MERLLLDASRAERPSDEHKQRMMALLGIGLPLSGPLAAPPPVVPGQAAAGLAPVASAGKSAMFGKVALGVGVVALLGAVVLTRQHDAVQPPAATVKPAVALQVALPPAPAPAVAEAAPAVSPLPPVEAAPAPVTPAVRGARPDASAADADLGEQIRLIEAARAGVSSHDAKGATAALDQYAAKFPRGSFGQEAMVLRIRAIDQAGDSARASALAKSFVARFPNSPHVARLKPIAERGASR
jgi:TolA-binding protein